MFSIMLTKQFMPDVKISLCILQTTEHQISNYIRLGLHNYWIWCHNRDRWRPQLHKRKEPKNSYITYFQHL